MNLKIKKIIKKHSKLVLITVIILFFMFNQSAGRAGVGSREGSFETIIFVLVGVGLITLLMGNHSAFKTVLSVIAILGLISIFGSMFFPFT